MSDTPRTDEAEYDARSWDDPESEIVVSADFARQLERELIAAQVKNEKLMLVLHEAVLLLRELMTTLPEGDRR